MSATNFGENASLNRNHRWNGSRAAPWLDEVGPASAYSASQSTTSAAAARLCAIPLARGTVSFSEPSQKLGTPFSSGWLITWPALITNYGRRGAIAFGVVRVGGRVWAKRST